MDLGHLAADPRFATFPDRLAHKEALLAILKPRFRELTTNEWLGRLRGVVPCAPVNSMAEALSDEQVLARDMIVEIKHPAFGTVREVASPIKTDGAITSPAPGPALGEHTEQIARDILRYDDARITALRHAGAFGSSHGAR
jgi:crotonobetainyl-CoA:carnitine CoA-transferase CaiB-like acyl-CoA transferase